MSKPHKSAADYMVIALSPALIMMLVGSLCFFLVEVFYRGKMAGAVYWVLFWFVLAIVLISRIAIELTTQHASVYGFALALVTWMFLTQSQPGWLLGALLLGLIWFCAHQLVFDCTLIDEDQDSSGQGLLQKTASQPMAAKPKTEKKSAGKPVQKRAGAKNPGRWVVYFSVAAIPLFGIGQMLLPADEAGSRRAGFIFLTMYLFAGLGLLLTTSFLGLRRYLRQRYLKMPPSIALAWIKFGAGVLIAVMAGSVLLPRPGATAAWTELSYKIDSVLRQASRYASPANHPGQGDGRPGDESGGKQGEAPKLSQEQQSTETSTLKKPGEMPSASRPEQASFQPGAPPAGLYNLLRTGFWILIAAVVAGWIVRERNFILEILRAAANAIRDFMRRFLALDLSRRPRKAEEAAPVRMKLSAFAEYKNPFFAAKDHLWPPEQIIIYTYEALRIWATEQGAGPRPEETAREFCRRLAGQSAALEPHVGQLARLYAHAAYGTMIPAGSDMEPIKELWRQLPTAGIQRTAAILR